MTSEPRRFTKTADRGPSPTRSLRGRTAGSRIVLAALLASGLAACDSGGNDPSRDTDPPAPVASVDTSPPVMTPDQLRERLGANRNAEFRMAGGKIQYAMLAESGVKSLEPLRGLELRFLDLRGLPISDLSPLEGMPLERLYLEGTEVTDLTPLHGMPLVELYLSETPVSDLSPLAGMRLDQLNLVGTKVKDLSALRDVEFGTLWLRETPVSDLGPLEGKALTSLDVQETSVSDLRPLASMVSLRRLNIAETDVTDLRPLEKLRLSRLIFTPAKITAGLDVVRGMESLEELDVEFREPQRLTPGEFWRRYEAGEFNP